MAKECGTCEYYRPTAGLYTEAKAGLCLAGSNPEPTTPKDGINCKAWRQNPAPPLGVTMPVQPVPLRDLAVKDISNTTKLPFNAPTKPINLNIQPNPGAVKAGDIIKVSFPDEWVVSAVGQTALLAFNPATEIERAFDLKSLSIQKVR